MNRKKISPRELTTLALLSALSYALMVVGRVPVVMFLSYDPKDVIITLGGLIWGPLTAVLVSTVVSLIEMVTVSSTGFIGLIMNILSTCAFACTASVIYKKKHSLKGALWGLGAGCAAMTGLMLLWNYLITPLYMGYPREAVAALLLPVFLPFNLIKSGLNAAFTYILYKPVIRALRRGGLVPAGAPAPAAPGRAPVRRGHTGYLLLAGLIIATCILWLLVLNGTI